MSRRKTNEMGTSSLAGAHSAWKLIFVIAVASLLILVHVDGVALWRDFAGLLLFSGFYHVLFYATALSLSAIFFIRTRKWILGFWEATVMVLPGLFLALPYWRAEAGLNDVYSYKGIGNVQGEPMLLGFMCAALFCLRVYVAFRWPAWRLVAIVALPILSCVLAIPVFLFVPELGE